MILLRYRLHLDAFLHITGVTSIEMWSLFRVACNYPNMSVELLVGWGDGEEPVCKRIFSREEIGSAQWLVSAYKKSKLSGANEALAGVDYFIKRQARQTSFTKFVALAALPIPIPWWMMYCQYKALKQRWKDDAKDVGNVFQPIELQQLFSWPPHLIDECKTSYSKWGWMATEESRTYLRCLNL